MGLELKISAKFLKAGNALLNHLVGSGVTETYVSLRPKTTARHNCHLVVIKQPVSEIIRFYAERRNVRE